MRIFFIAFVFLISCSGKDDTASKVDIFSQQGILLLGNGTEPSGIDPHIVTGVPEHKILLALLEGLVIFNPKTNGVLPGVASEWNISKDGLIYTFTFNPEAANVFTGPAEIAFTLIWSAPMLFARYLVVDSKAAFATPMTL